MSAPVPVFLLKTKSTPKDGYLDYFSTAASPSYAPHFVPVLDHTFSQDALRRVETMISVGAFSDSHHADTHYGGLIFTSQRAVEAFIKIVHSLRSQAADLTSLLPPTLPLYVVGPATARSLATLGLPCSILGEETGNGEALAHFMQRHYNTSHSPQPSLPKPALLFLVGEQRRDVIPKTLQNPSLPETEQIQVEELTVYETAVFQSFPDDFRKLLQTVPASVPLRWVIVFSPTGCQAMLRVLGLLDDSSGKVAPAALEAPRDTLIATIGPTTRDYLIRNFDFEPDACAEKPTPEGVAQSIASYVPRRAQNSQTAQ